jgi:hypothetical protein
MGLLIALIGIVADLIAVNRRLLEKVLAHQQTGLEAPAQAQREPRAEVSAA